LYNIVNTDGEYFIKFNFVFVKLVIVYETMLIYVCFLCSTQDTIYLFTLSHHTKNKTIPIHQPKT